MILHHVETLDLKAPPRPNVTIPTLELTPKFTWRLKANWRGSRCGRSLRAERTGETKIKGWVTLQV